MIADTVMLRRIAYVVAQHFKLHSDHHESLRGIPDEIAVFVLLVLGRLPYETVLSFSQTLRETPSEHGEGVSAYCARLLL